MTGGFVRGGRVRGVAAVALTAATATAGLLFRTRHRGAPRAGDAPPPRTGDVWAAVRAERRHIAGELHDSIAHHLTVIAMHAQMLDDEHVRIRSQEAIRLASRKALSDLRFFIDLAEESATGTALPSHDLAAAMDEACRELQDAGHIVRCTRDDDTAGLPRNVEIVLARIIREASTNILRHGASGAVHASLAFEASEIVLTIRSPLATSPRHDLASSGTGLHRMAERVLGVQGRFAAGPDDDQWVITARLPRTDVSDAASDAA